VTAPALLPQHFLQQHFLLKPVNVALYNSAVVACAFYKTEVDSFFTCQLLASGEAFNIPVSADCG
jgi:hypothetical protein